MFEYWFIGLKDGDGTFDHTGTTHDFLEVVCQIAQTFSPEVAGHFVREFLKNKKKELAFLRVIEWKFEFLWVDPEHVTDEATYLKIILHKHR